MTTIQYTGELTVMTCWCGMHHAVPAELDSFQRRQHHDGARDVRGIYCPLGHQHVPTGKGKAQIERERAEKAERDAANAREEVRVLHAELVTEKAKAKKAAKRASAGVCPCCKRSFVQLSRHMSTKHPDHATP